MATEAKGRRRAGDDPLRDDFVADVAAMYYEQRLDQEEIARRVGVSRSTVSRILAEALDSGIVEIRIRRPLPLAAELQREVAAAYGLRDALVLDSRGTTRDALARVGRLAARYLETNLGDGDVLAISWGLGVRSVADALEPRRPAQVEVVQMLGGAGSRDPDVDGTELARRFADQMGGRYRYLNAPLVVDDEELARSLLRQRSIRDTLAAAAAADIAVVGIGAFVPEVSSLLRAGHITPAGLADIRRLGAVGDVCGHFFTRDGEPVDCEVSRRIVTIDASALRRIPRIIGVACGIEKAEAIVGAMRAGLVNILVTDDTTARAVLKF